MCVLKWAPCCDGPSPRWALVYTSRRSTNPKRILMIQSGAPGYDRWRRSYGLASGILVQSAHISGVVAG